MSGVIHIAFYMWFLPLKVNHRHDLLETIWFSLRKLYKDIFSLLFRSLKYYFNLILYLADYTHQNFFVSSRTISSQMQFLVLGTWSWFLKTGVYSTNLESILWAWSFLPYQRCLCVHPPSLIPYPIFQAVAELFWFPHYCCCCLLNLEMFDVCSPRSLCFLLLFPLFALCSFSKISCERSKNWIIYGEILRKTNEKKIK